MSDQPTDALRAYKAALTEACSEILKTVMEAMADPEGGIGIDQVYALIDGRLEPVVRALIEREYQRGFQAAKEMAAQHSPKFYWQEEGTFQMVNQSGILAWVGCNCGWNADGKDKADDGWGQHIRSLDEKPAEDEK